MTEPRIDRAMKREALRTNEFFGTLSREDLDAIVDVSSERRVAKGTVIFNKGDPGSSMMAVLTGRVRIFSVSGDGREVTLNTIDAGEVFGEIALLDGKPRSAAAVAQEDCVLMVVERQHFVPLMSRNQKLLERVLTVLTNRLRQTSIALEELALFDLEARLARLITKLAAEYGKKQPDGTVRIEVRMSDTDMGTLVASSRESVNKQLRLWRERGVLEKQKGYLVIHKPDALARRVV